MDQQAAPSEQWLHARDLLLGLGGHKRNFAQGLELARLCADEEARWICDLFSHQYLATVGDTFSSVVLQSRINATAKDGRGLCYRGLLACEDRDLLLQSANLGCALAQARMAHLETDPVAKLEWARKSAALNEREGFYELGICLSAAGERSESNEAFRQAAEMGSASAQFMYGMCAFPLRDVRLWKWVGRAARGGMRSGLSLGLLQRIVQEYEAGNMQFGAVLYEIGGLLQRCRQVFGLSFTSEQEICVEKAVQFHTLATNRLMRLNVQSWLIAGTRMGVPRDVRCLIGKLLRKMQEDTEFHYVEEPVKPSASCVVS